MGKLRVLATIPHTLWRESSVGTHNNNGRGTASAWRTRGHILEHVAGSKWGKVGVNLG
jgi:hypothetical protein